MRDTGPIYRKLPSLPEDADIVLIRSAQGPDGSRKQFRKKLTVRRRVVQTWLEYLKDNHSGYGGIEIDHDALSQLPQDDTAEERIQRDEYEPDTEDLQSDNESDPGSRR